jgi:hypothetical protein
MPLAFGKNRFIWQHQSQNALRVCKFKNKMADQHQPDEVQESILTRLEMLLTMLRQLFHQILNPI